MLCVRIIPCLDVSHGRVVKGINFQGLRDAGAPDELAAVYEGQGADELVFLDVSATHEGRDTQIETVEKVRARVAIPITVGGGVRSVEDARMLLAAGADKVSMNTAAVLRHDLVREVATEFGRQCTVVAIDARRFEDRDSWEVVIRGGREGTGDDALDWAEEAASLGAGELLLTSWDRDGTRSGYDLELLEAVSQRVNIPVIASGGAAHARHLAEALEAGADAVLAASIFHDGDTTVADLKDELAEYGIRIRR